MPDTDLTQQITDTAAGPAQASNDSASVRAQPIRDLIDADRYLRAKRAGRRPMGGVRLTRTIPPDAI